MRPETARNRIQKAIDRKLSTGDGSGLKDCLPAMIRLWERFAKEEGDYRTIDEIGGLSDDTESIRNKLIYISDRWRCAHRLRWLIEAVSRGKL